MLCCLLCFLCSKLKVNQRWQRTISARMVALHARAREQNLVSAPAPTTRHGQQPVPVPPIRGQGWPVGMPVCPPAGQRGRRPSGARDEDGGQPGRATRKAGEAMRVCDEEGDSQLARAPRASEEEAPRRPVATPPWPPLEEARAGRDQPW